MKNYNRSLDLMAAAAILAGKGQTENAAKAFTAAVKDPSIAAALRVIESSNKAAYAKASRRVRANDGSTDSENPGEELRVEVDENGDRTVQEAKAATARAMRQRAAKLLTRADAMEDCDDDMDADDGDFEATASEEGDDDTDMSFLDGDDSTADADMDGDLDEDEIDSEPVETSAKFIKAFGARAAKVPAKAAVKPVASTASAFARAVRNINALK